MINNNKTKEKIALGSNSLPKQNFTLQFIHIIYSRDSQTILAYYRSVMCH